MDAIVFIWNQGILNPMINALVFLYAVLFSNMGLSIIGFTVFIRLGTTPLTLRQIRQMRAMTGLQPKIQELREKYKDDSQKMNQKLMAFMKEHKVNPMAGCLPMLIQIPVFFGFFFMIRTAVELRGAAFLWAGDLSSPDTIFTIPGITFLPFFSNADLLRRRRQQRDG